MKMKINSRDYRVREGDDVNFQKWPTKAEPVYKSKEEYQDLLADHVAQLSSQQELLYASNRYAVLLIFQAMDTAGKDGAIKHVMSGVNPQGCQVFSFKHPSPNYNTIFSGAPPANYWNADVSASSIDLTTRRC
jgi:polyphosphate kinase 2 (PPK2 family)